MKLIKTLAVGAAITLAGAGSIQAGTLDDVKAADAGEWQGFDPSVCQAVAAAVFGDPSKVKYTTTTGKTRFTALASGEVDMLARNTTWTFSRDVDLKFEFVGVNYYDGQGFMIPTSLGVDSAKDLDGASVCIQTGTTTELNLADFFRVNNISYEPVPIETNEEAQTNYLAGRCDVYTTDASGLAATRSAFDKPDDHKLLPEIISKEPLGPLVRHGDSEWADIVRWKLGAMLGLEGNWAVNALKANGNYGEIFDKFIGSETPIALERGLNAQWTDGGILYVPPFR